MSQAASDDPRAELASLAASLRAYLEWQRDAGTIGFPRRTDDKAPMASITRPAAVATSSMDDAPSPAPRPQPPPVASDRAAATVDDAGDPERIVILRQIAQTVSGCTKCRLSESRTQTVFARGSPDARVCFIGEAPGADEDEQGFPFVGRAGQLLDRMIQAMGLDPTHDVYVCNVVKCRPPGNRKPEPDEMASCSPYLDEQLAVVKPRVIVALGNTAVGGLLDTQIGITKLRGQWKLYRGILVMPTYHPSYLLRPSPQQAEAKRQAWEDLQLVMKELGLPLPSLSKR